jgi:hypothetical protein
MIHKIGYSYRLHKCKINYVKSKHFLFVVAKPWENSDGLQRHKFPYLKYLSYIILQI